MAVLWVYNSTWPGQSKIIYLSNKKLKKKKKKKKKIKKKKIKKKKKKKINK